MIDFCLILIRIENRSDKMKENKKKTIILFIRYDCLLLVDAVDTLGAVKIQVDQWKIDVAYSTSQKALGTASGLVPLTLSSRALDKLKSRQKSIRIAHWDILSLVDAWNHYDESKYL